MCGIAGIINLRPNPAPERDRLERMLTALYHRGPDEFGLYRDDSAGLAHARLSIIDLKSGQQPMSNIEGDSWIVFNGEIFNYLELRHELEALGHHFRTHSDTEVIVHAWQHWGEDALARFNGQWAFALWNSKQRRLTLARDRLGIRPLYYAEHQGRVVFGSEVKALFAGVPDLPRKFDRAGLDETLTFWTVVAPRTVFEGVAELPPGSLRTYDGEKVTERAYWSPMYTPSFEGSISEATEAVRSALHNATELRMLRADVPVGCYLSGGIDSSLVAALAHRAVDGERFHTFSLRFEDAEYDETPYQRAMVEQLGSKHHEVEVSRSDIAQVFPDVIHCAERPILRTAPAPLFLLSQLVRKTNIKVVLTGEGADEMFAGYDIFREGVVRRFWARQPDSASRPRLLERLYPYLARSPVSQQAMARKFFGRELERWRSAGFAHGTRWHTTASLKRLLAPEMRHQGDVVQDLFNRLPEDFENWSYLARDQYLEVRTLLSGYLLSSQGDRMLMGNSVEGRFPFLDPEVVNLANSLPDPYKLRVLDEKHILKRVSRELVPESIRTRKKQPYRAPDALSFVGAAKPDYVDALLSERKAKEVGVFQPSAVASLWGKCQSRAEQGQFSNTDNMALVATLSTHLLHEQLIRQGELPAPEYIHTLVDRVTGEERMVRRPSSWPVGA